MEDGNISIQTQSPEERRVLVLSSIIIKKVLSSNASKSGDKQNCKSIYNQSDNNDAREETIASSSDSSDSSGTEFFDDDPDIKKCTENIIVGNFRSLSSIISHSVENKKCTVGLCSLKSCPICLERYIEGEKTCCSRNKKCTHFFHLDYMLDWLCKQNGCPLCRED